MLGPRGQDGTLICKSLIQKNYEVIGLSHQKSSSRLISQNISEIDKEIKLEIGDIKNYTTIENLINRYQPQEIYNLAGQSSIITSSQVTSYCCRINDNSNSPNT